MFRSNNTCIIRTSSGKTDVYGKPLPGNAYTEKCAVVKLEILSEKSAVRADTSATRGNARELQAHSLILLASTTRANIDDVIEIMGYSLRILGKQPRYSASGALDHYEVTASVWS
jgi:hypothetical protein